MLDKEAVQQSTATHAAANEIEKLANERANFERELDIQVMWCCVMECNCIAMNFHLAWYQVKSGQVRLGQARSGKVKPVAVWPSVHRKLLLHGLLSSTIHTLATADSSALLVTTLTQFLCSQPRPRCPSNPPCITMWASVPGLLVTFPNHCTHLLVIVSSSGSNAPIYGQARFIPMRVTKPAAGAM